MSDSNLTLPTAHEVSLVVYFTHTACNCESATLPFVNHKCSVPEHLSCASHRLLPGQPLDKVIGMMYKLPADDRRAILTRTATELLQVRHLQVVKVDQVQGKDMSTFCNCTCNSHDSLLMLTCFASQMLADVHAKGIAHGDLKPANIFLDLQSCQTMTHVLDWGLAKRYQPGILQPAICRLEIPVSAISKSSVSQLDLTP